MILRHSPIVAIVLVGSLAAAVSAADKKPNPQITATPSLFLRINHDFHHVAISPDGKYLTVQERIANKPTLLVIETASKKVVHRLPPAHHDSVTFTPNSTRLVCLRCRYETRKDQVDYFVNVHDVKTGKLLREVPLPGMPQSEWGGAQFGLPYAVADDVFVIAWRTPVATVYSMRTGKALGDLPGTMHLQFLSISRDGRWLLTLDGKRNLRVWDVKKRKLDCLLYESLRDVEAIALSPDGKWCAALLTGDRTMIFDRSTSGVKATTSLGIRARGVAFTADGKRLVAKTSGGIGIGPPKGFHDWGLRLWDWQDDMPVREIYAPIPPKAYKFWSDKGRFYPRIMTTDGSRFFSYGGITGILLLDLKNPNPPPDWEPDEQPKGKKP